MDFQKLIAVITVLLLTSCASGEKQGIVLSQEPAKIITSAEPPSETRSSDSQKIWPIDSIKRAINVRPPPQPDPTLTQKPPAMAAPDYAVRDSDGNIKSIVSPETIPADQFVADSSNDEVGEIFPMVGEMLGSDFDGDEALMAVPAAGVEASNPEALTEYKVRLAVNKKIQKPGPAGELKVWIGDPNISVRFADTMTTAETILPAIGQSAKVTPFAPDFEVSPAASLCMKIHPSGSETHFSIRPKATGMFKVGVDVLLYDSSECTGAPVPKSAASLNVEVVVNKEGVAIGYLKQLWQVLWQGIVDFWTWLVATFFGLCIFLLRNRLKKRFGFDA